ncbi:hypothetical protein M514_23482 [Trichuris suis]|uniref:Reverse transcriptase domain-containing protein n=1 Tax=Trichuris suis TaxID=68888 RepID=A0A085N4B8_9BILA|nr:hypothetical protein M514_23482 [Trichuris suis]
MQITDNQYGFRKGCSTTDSVHGIRLLMERYREKNRTLYVAFIDLEKAFDALPHSTIWLALREHNVPEEYVNWIKMICKEATSRVSTSTGETETFPVTVGVHQGSALSPLLFITVMDTVTRTSKCRTPIQCSTPTMLSSWRNRDKD